MIAYVSRFCFDGFFFSHLVRLLILMTYEEHYLLISVLRDLYFTMKPVVPHAKYSTAK